MASEVSSVLVGIKNGPSKYELMLALFDQSARNPRPVTFVLESTGDSTWWMENQKLVLHITSVSIEDGSGEGWNFEGRAPGVWSSLHKGYYSTDRRNGHIIGVTPPTQEVLDAHERMGTRGVLKDLASKYRRD